MDRMRENDVSSLAVMQDWELIRILSEGDIVQPVAKRMIDLGVRHLPVVDSRGLVGVVSARDLLNLEAWNS